MQPTRIDSESSDIEAKPGRPQSAAFPGGFRQYMQVRADKLHRQAEEKLVLRVVGCGVLCPANSGCLIRRLADSGATQGALFADLSIYVNGYTEPSHQELKRLISLHGGTFQHYCMFQCKICRCETSN